MRNKEFSFSQKKNLIFLVCFFFLSSFSYGETESSCLNPSRKAETVQKFLAVQRTLGCRNSSNLNLCRMSLGLGIGAGLGAMAALRVRSPEFHLCPMKSTSLLFHFIEPDFAWAGYPLCQGIESLIKERAKQSIFTIQKELDEQIENYKDQQNSLKQMKEGISKGRSELYSEAKRSLIDQQLRRIEQSHPLWSEIEKASEAMKNKFDDWKVANREGRKDAADRLKKERDTLRENIEKWTGQIHSTQDYQNKFKEYDAAVKEHYDVIDRPSQGKEKIAQINSDIEKIKESVDRIVQEKKELEALSSKLNRNFLQTVDLHKILDDIYNHGALSPKSYEYIRSLQTMEKGREGLVLSASREKGVMSRRFREIIEGRKQIGQMKFRLGLVGTATSLISAAASAKEADAGHGLSKAAESLVMENLPISGTGCTEFSPYISYENNNNNCQPVFGLETQKSQNFFQLSVDEMLKETGRDSRLCQLIQGNFEETFQKHESVQCADKPRINYVNGNFIQVLASGSEKSFQELQWKDGGKSYTMKFNKDGQVENLRVLNWVGTTYGEKDPETIQARQSMQTKFLPDLLETMACCSSSGIRPTNAECLRKKVQPQKGFSENPLDLGSEKQVTK